MSYNDALNNAKGAIEGYNNEILNFLSDNGKCKIKASMFLTTYMNV